MSSNKVERPDFRKNNSEPAKRIKDAYTLSDLSEIIALLKQHNTLVLRRYASGGASAVTILDADSLNSALGDNLQFMWTRDSVLQALASTLCSTTLSWLQLRRSRPISGNAVCCTTCVSMNTTRVTSSTSSTARFQVATKRLLVTPPFASMLSRARAFPARMASQAERRARLPQLPDVLAVEQG